MFIYFGNLKVTVEIDRIKKYYITATAINPFSVWRPTNWKRVLNIGRWNIE